MHLFLGAEHGATYVLGRGREHMLRGLGFRFRHLLREYRPLLASAAGASAGHLKAALREYLGCWMREVLAAAAELRGSPSQGV